jgi:non-ribosomal peptide synthetase-like protein
MLQHLHAQLPDKKQDTLALVIAAVQVLLFRYSASTSEVLDIKIRHKTDDEIKNPIYRNEHQLHLQKAINGKQSFLEILANVRHELEGFLSKFDTNIPFATELKWVTDNDGPQLEYKIAINDVRQGSCKLNFNAPDFCRVFKNASQHLSTLLESIANNPTSAINELQYIGNSEKELLNTFNYGPTDEEIKTPELLHALFEQTAAKYPNNIAVVADGVNHTYEQINTAANELAPVLAFKGITVGSFVGILLKRSPEVYISMLAVLKAGGAYVPLDMGYPDDRINFILQDSGATLLITSPHAGKTIDAKCEVLLFDDKLRSTMSENLPLSTPHIPFDSPAYMVYTSGTTGRPKGVKLPHSAISNLVKAEGKTFNVQPTDRVLQGFSVAFDASLEEIWLAFRSGAALVPAPEEAMYSGYDLTKFLQEQSITVLSTVPTMLSMMQPPLPLLKLLILGGESCPDELPRPWHHKDLRIVNSYGPTEATVIATYADFDPKKKITIGKPVINYSTFIVDAQQRPVAVGVPGELCIGGAGLALGYLNRPELNAEKFTTAPLGADGEEIRIYRSGDLTRFNDEGNIEFLGRIDSQVKLRGFRIELAEIESQLLQFKDVMNAVVAVKEDEHKVQRLVAYVLLKDKSIFADEELWREELKTKLAAYMVPSVYMVLDEFPVLPSGKVDRKQLPTPEKSHIKDTREIVPPSTPTEEKLHTLWKKYFSPQEVSVLDDFFELGGHSLLASLIVSEIRKAPDMPKISVQDIYTYRSITALAEMIDELAVKTQQQQERPVSRPKAVSNARFMLTAFLQSITFGFLFFVAGVIMLGPYIVDRLFPGFNVYELIVLSILGVFVVILPLLTCLSIAAKWIFIGKFKQGRYPLWGSYYFRSWIVMRLIDLTPIWIFAGTPLITWYFRMMGAKIGKRVYLGTDRLRMFDLISIGDNSSIAREAHLMGFRYENGELIVGRTTVGKDCFVGTRSVLSLNSVMEDGAELGELSMLEPGATIPSGEHWEGSAAVFTHKTPPKPVDNHAKLPMPVFVVLQLIAITFIMLFPLVLLMPFTLLFYNIAIHFGFGWALLSTLFSCAAYTVCFCLLVSLLKWLIVGKVKEETFSIYSFRYIRNWMVDTMLHMSLISFRPIYATIYMPYWLRLMGAKVGKHAEISTVNQMSTDLLSIGSGSFLADSVSVGSPDVRNGIMYLKATNVGSRTFIGNSAVLASGKNVGNECLIGVMSTPPKQIDADKVNGTSWLGSPSIYLPKRQESEKFPEELTFNPSMHLILKRGFIEFFKITLPFAFSSCMAATFYFIMATTLRGISLYHIFWLASPIMTVLIVATPLLAALFKWVLIGKYKPQNKPLWSVFVWKNELVNSLCESMAYPLLVNMTLGTPFAPMFFRTMGCKIGKRVYMGTTEITEFDLVNVKDDACLNYMCTIQTHLFEDRVMKMANLHIGEHCTVGPLAVVLYDSVMEDDSKIEALSLVMKGEILPKNTTWSGSPSKFIG